MIKSSKKGACAPFYSHQYFNCKTNLSLGKENYTIKEKRKMRGISGQGPKQNLCVTYVWIYTEMVPIGTNHDSVHNIDGS